MKKMLAKAVALSLVLGGVGFVANDALAASNAELEQKIQQESLQRVLNDSNLQTNINNEAKARENADNELGKNINTNKDNITKETSDRAEADSKLSDRIDANKKAIDKEVQDRQDAIKQERNARTVAELNLGEQITDEKKDRKDADNKLSEAIDKEEKARKYDSLILDAKITDEKNDRIDAGKAEAAARKDADNALRTDLNQETIDRVDADNRLQTAIDQKADKTTVAENTAAIESNKAAIAQEKKDRDHADQKLQDQITINKGQIENEATNRANEDKRIEAKFDGEVSRLDGRIDKLNDNVQKVGAMAAAIANLHTMGYDPEAPTEIAVGVGQYRDKTGLALGAFHYPNRDFMLSFNVSTAGDEFMGGIGATWRFGRKSPEELRQAEAEKAAKAKLAKAEAAKKAAKDARVAAQQKRHAEMLAARTGK